MRRSTLQDVAKAAGVHPGTASRALNSETRSMVAPATVKRVLEAAERLVYSPNAVARGLRRQRSQTVGVLIPDLTNASFPPIVRGIENALSPRGFTAIIANTDNDERMEQRAFEAFRARQVDGFIFAGARRDLGVVQDAFDQGIPSVLANRLTDVALFPWVAADDDFGIRQTLDYLVSLGHSGIAYIAGPQNISTGSTRAASFRRHVELIGLSVGECPLVQGNAFDTTSGVEGVRHILAHYPDVTAILCGNDMSAVGALSSLREAGLRCPDDMSIVGFNDMLLARDLAPSLTTVRVPLEELGRRSAELLLDELAGLISQNGIILPTELIKRGSTSAPRILTSSN